MSDQGGAAPLTLEPMTLESEPNQGFPASIEIPLWDFKTSGALTLTAGTNPVIATTSSYLHINWAASDSSVLLASKNLGFEYDPAMDELYLDLAFNQTGSTDTITVDATAQPMRAGIALATAKTSTGSITVPNGATAGIFTWRRIRFDGKVFKPRDQVQFLITPSAHTTDALFLGGAMIVMVRNSCFNARGSRFTRKTATP